ncbi:uncharacterized protein LOC143019684 isoform X2 [Oratosquilla oratoria]|uniref:uncharacterized protein LOC143019684 isoform X2 n=1 Tax=Oratosquilla oratoria TaxID=337810 RepID=UPI003F77118C
MGESSLKGLVKLEQVDLQGNPILTVHKKAFEGLPALMKLILKEARNLTEFPSLNGTSNLDLIRIERSALTSIPEQLCDFTPKLRSLILHRNKISEIPDLNNCRDLRLIDLEMNNIASIGSELFWGLSNLQDLLLHNNHIPIITQKALVGLGQLQFLNLENNQISHIDPDAFKPLKRLKELNLANNIFPNIPSAGLQGVEVFKVHNNRYLRNFPGPESFPMVQFLYLSYAYHCCPFLSLEEEEVEEQPVYGETVIDSEDGIKGLGTLNWNISTNWTAQVAEPANLNSHYSSSPSPLEILPTDQGSVFSSNAWEFSRHARQSRRIVQCIPKPGPFMPCKDLFDWWTLRCGVWIVFLLALLGNGTVVFVLIFARTKMDVPRFLVCNLAMADFFMGIYLGFLAVADASTLGKFRMYAIPWQMSSACQIAGFVGVLSSELSVYTLAVITMERNYAITHAMHLNKRLSLKHAAYIMTVGWIFALAMAVLPLTGVSDYRKFAVCLPFETSGAGLGYVVFLMFINGVAFLILMGCYLKMYCAIRGSQAWNSNDSRIAKRMALLVFTDLICWAPIAFFSLTAAFGMHLISLEEAKVFTVFILPLNSCCNPFLYAILTKQFKKDCVMLCKAIEESRVTRGIGRCRHSSNFSNRQTPANTNSALEHSFRECSQTCSCSTKRSEQSKNMRRWRLSALKYLLCHKDHEELNSSSDYSYQTSKNNPKDKRHASVSSDNFSSSRSDSWQRGHATLSLRLLERKRRPSWHLTRKPSQESNLSSSRNDSSITTASTSTWRMSRSSVSSDISNPGSRPVVKADSQTSLRLGPARGRGTEMRPQGPTRQMSQGQLTGKQITIPHNPRSESLNRTKPKLQRQEAIERETYLPNKNGGATSPDDLTCPLHHRNDRLTCVYEQESCEDDDQMRHEPNRAYLAPNYQLMGLSVGFVPRKLSTISSHSVSVSKDPEREESKSARGSSTDVRITKDPESSSLQACPSSISASDLPRNLKCTSLTLLPQTQSPIVALRFPSDNHLTSNIPRRGEAVLMIDTDANSRTPRDIEVFRHMGEPSMRKEVVTLITGDDDDEVFLDEAPAPLETHFPLEVDVAEEVHPLI